MNAENLRRVIGTAFVAALVGIGPAAQAHEHGEQWALANEYPATSLPGEGDALFAKLVADRTQGRVSIVTMPDARLGYKSRDHLKAVAEAKIAMADSFGGALGEEHPLFGLSALPFIVASFAEARALYAAARPAYEDAFAKRNQKLLFSTPWPASGLWTKSPVDSAAALARLRIRAYDKTGTELFARLGATASVVSFADLGPKLASGEIDAVLSSGDGGAGRKLWEHLPRFTQIQYAIPLSFTTVNLDKWNALDALTRGEVQEAAAETEARQWQAVEGRVAQNYARMRENGMAIATEIPAQLQERFRDAARFAVDDWAAKAGPEGRALLNTIKPRYERR